VGFEGRYGSAVRYTVRGIAAENVVSVEMCTFWYISAGCRATQYYSFDDWGGHRGGRTCALKPPMITRQPTAYTQLWCTSCIIYHSASHTARNRNILRRRPLFLTAI